MRPIVVVVDNVLPQHAVRWPSDAIALQARLLLGCCSQGPNSAHSDATSARSVFNTVAPLGARSWQLCIRPDARFRGIGPQAAG